MTRARGAALRQHRPSAEIGARGGPEMSQHTPTGGERLSDPKALPCSPWFGTEQINLCPMILRNCSSWEQIQSVLSVFFEAYAALAGD